MNSLYDKDFLDLINKTDRLNGELKLIKYRTGTKIKIIKKGTMEVIETCDFCNKDVFKSNGKSELECENRANTGSCEGLKPLQYSQTHNGLIKQGRNEKCQCGSGKKHKYCCIIKT